MINLTPAQRRILEALVDGWGLEYREEPDQDPDADLQAYLVKYDQPSKPVHARTVKSLVKRGLIVDRSNDEAELYWGEITPAGRAAIAKEEKTSDDDR